MQKKFRGSVVGIATRKIHSHADTAVCLGKDKSPSHIPLHLSLLSAFQPLTIKKTIVYLQSLSLSLCGVTVLVCTLIVSI